MAEKELVPSTETGVFDAEAMVRGMLRAIEHLGRVRPANTSSVVLEELPEAAGAVALHPPPTAPAPTPLLRRPRAAGATDPGVILPPANDGQGGQAADLAVNRGPSAPEEVDGAGEATEASPVMALWAALELQLAEAQAASRRA